MRSLTNSSVRGTSQIAVNAAGFVKADASGFLSTVATAGSSVTESETPPSSPAAGDLWYNTTIGRTFVYYSNTWVEANPAVSGPASNGAYNWWYFNKYQPNKYYVPPFGTPAGQGIDAGVISFTPWVVKETVTLTRMAVRVNNSVVNSVVALGVYNNDSTTDTPTTKLLDAGTVDGASTGFKSITVNQVLTPGLYWIAELATGGATVISAYSGAILPYTPTVTSPQLAANQNSRWLMTGQTSLPATATPTATTGANIYVPMVYLGFGW
jgi:hypothetical protein